MVDVGRGVWKKKTRVDECWRLDMQYLRKLTDFQFEDFLQIEWKSSWGQTCAIILRVCPPNLIRFQYTVTYCSTGRKQNLDYYTRIESTPCFFGGVRWWFYCPKCGRRCRILYLPPEHTTFACRVCFNLTYASQQEGPSIFKRLHKLMTRIRRRRKHGEVK